MMHNTAMHSKSNAHETGGTGLKMDPKMTTYKISDSCPVAIVFQSLPSGDYDYSACGSAEAAWEEEEGEDWVQTHIEEGGGTRASAKAEFLDSMTEASPAEALAAAISGYTWPLNLGFVEEEEEGE